MSLWDYLNPFGDPSIEGEIVCYKTKSGMWFCVYLPPGYDSTKEYPILYHLHGAGEAYFMMKREVMWTAEQFEKRNKSIIIVGPLDSTKFSMWTDGKKIQAATLFVDEVIPQMEATYSVNNTRSSRFLQGFSMGGFGAASLGFLHPEKFGKIIIWDGALHDWKTLSENRSFIARGQFDNKKENFDPWSPWEASSKLAKSEQLQNTPVKMYSGTMEATRDFSNRYYEHLVNEGASMQHIKCDCPHILKSFLCKQGKAGVEFLLSE